MSLPLLAENGTTTTTTTKKPNTVNKKRWTFESLSTSVLNKVGGKHQKKTRHHRRRAAPQLSLESCNDDDNDADDHIPVLEIQFQKHQVKGGDSADDEESATSLMLELEEEGDLPMTMEDLEVAVMQERYQGIQEIHSAMTQINQIQKGTKNHQKIQHIMLTRPLIHSTLFFCIPDLALVVEGQSHQVSAVATHVMDSAAQAAAGLGHVQALHQSAIERNRRRREKLLSLISFVMGAFGMGFIAFGMWNFMSDVATSSTPGTSSQVP